MTKTKNADGSITYDMQDGTKPWHISADRVAEYGETGLDKAMSYTPSPYSKPAEYAHMYVKNEHEED